MSDSDGRQFLLEEEIEASVQHDLAILREHFADLGELPSLDSARNNLAI